MRITAGALWADTRLGAGYSRLLEAARSCDIGWIREPTRDISAVAWLSSLPEGADVSARAMAKAYIGGLGAALGSLGGLVISKGTKNRHGR